MREAFRRIAQRAAHALGTPAAFLAAVAVIALWAATGPLFHFSDTWQLLINTTTTVMTFLMVFIIQNTQNRDATVIHLKLDELLRAVKEARTSLVDMESLSEEEIERLQREFARLGKDEAARLNERGTTPAA
jgi:low affinity Fe/Cu permease